MRRSITYCEPGFALAGQNASWKFVYSPATTLKKGSRLKFDLLSKGREIDWEIPETKLNQKNSNLIYAIVDKHDKPLQAKEVETPDSYNPQYEFTLPIDLKPEELFTVVLGPLKDSSKNGNQCQSTVQRRRPFLLYVDPKKKGHYEDPEIFTIDIRGNVLDHISVLAPSFVEKNKRFDIIVRFEDEFNNLTNNAPEDTLVELTYENQRENLNWKLFVPETGFITIPNFYFNEEGIYRIQLQNLKTKEKFFSSPIKCFAEGKMQLFWGLLHGESERIDSTENIESCLRHFRDDLALNFFSSSNFESSEETPNEMWKNISQNINDFNEEERFVTFSGFQWQGENKKEGLRQFIHAKEPKSILRKKDSKYNSLKKIYKSHSPKDLISIPCFSMGQSMSYHFDNFNGEFERVVEIFNAWGSSECSRKDGNPLPINAGKHGVKEELEGSVIKALQKGLRFGFVAGGLDDRGCYSELFESDQEQYSPGLTAIIAKHHSREKLFDALYNRQCYATSGKKIILYFELADQCMGSEISLEEKPGLKVNRHLNGFVAGTTEIESLEIIRNGKVIFDMKDQVSSFEFEHDDMEDFTKAAIESQEKKPKPFIFYYLRVKQKDGHMAWSSPIWVDDKKITKT